MSIHAEVGHEGDLLLPVTPRKAVENSHVPTLLIAGTADRDIPTYHAQELEQSCLGHCVLWIVPGAGNGGAATFHWQVVNWFQKHE